MDSIGSGLCNFLELATRKSGRGEAREVEKNNLLRDCGATMLAGCLSSIYSGRNNMANKESARRRLLSRNRRWL